MESIQTTYIMSRITGVKMHKLDQKTIACAVFTMVLFGSLTARIETASAQGFEGTRLAQALTAKQQKLKDTLTGRTRSVVLGPPVKRHRQQKRRIQEIIRKNTTRAPALPGPSLPRPDPSSAAPRDQARPGGVEFSAEPVEVDEPVAPVQHMTKADREDIKKITDDNKLPAVNVEIYFKYNSAEINPRSYPALISLGQVLVEPELKGLTFLVAGYTDA